MGGAGVGAGVGVGTGVGTGVGVNVGVGEADGGTSGTSEKENLGVGEGGGGGGIIFLKKGHARMIDMTNRMTATMTICLRHLWTKIVVTSRIMKPKRKVARAIKSCVETEIGSEIWTTREETVIMAAKMVMAILRMERVLLEEDAGEALSFLSGAGCGCS